MSTVQFPLTYLDYMKYHFQNLTLVFSCNERKINQVNAKKPDMFLLHATNALSLYRSQNVLCRSKLFGPDQKLSCNQYCSKGFCAGTKTNALSFYRSQNVLCWSNFFVLDQRFIYILWKSLKFCARQTNSLHSVKLVFVPTQKFLKRH